MANGKQLELKKEQSPGLIFRQLEAELTQGGETFLDVFSAGKHLLHLGPVASYALFDQREKNVFLALELSVDGTFGAAGKCRNFPQLRSFVSVSNEDRLR